MWDNSRNFIIVIEKKIDFCNGPIFARNFSIKNFFSVNMILDMTKEVREIAKLFNILDKTKPTFSCGFDHIY